MTNERRLCPNCHSGLIEEIFEEGYGHLYLCQKCPNRFDETDILRVTNKKRIAWKIIMDMAKEEGFIRFAYAGVAVLHMNNEEEEGSV